MKDVLCILLGVYWLILFVRIIASWFPPPRSGPLAAIMGLVYDLTDPVMRPLRGLIPPARFGAMAIDFSPIIIFVVIAVIRAALGCTGFIV